MRASAANVELHDRHHAAILALMIGCELPDCPDGVLAAQGGQCDAAKHSRTPIKGEV